MNPTEYKSLLQSFLQKGFCFRKFEEFNVDEKSQVILRHDVDFSIDMAVQMADLEQKVGLFSTFYFLLASDSYNLLSKKNSESVKLIAEMGHSVGLHFDPTIYDDEKSGFNAELEIFERNFGETLSMSFHRPSQLVLEGVNWLPRRMLGTYQEEFFKDIAYISDSQGIFRFGHPFENDAFVRCDNMQLLIHPIWWMTNQSQAVEKIQDFLIIDSDMMSDHIARNCTPWKKYNE
ncbi:hypothetical protein N8936_00750 [Porticoccaceae bacterium]|nr:hypothetical protein [Porticoccaceae bacterium]